MSVAEPTLLKGWKLLAHSWAHWVHLAYAAILIASYAISDAIIAREVKVTIAYISLFVYVLVLVTLLTYALLKHDRYVRSQALVSADLSRQARYAAAIECIRSAVHQLNEAHLYIGSCYESSSHVNQQVLRSHLQPALDSVTKAFGISTGVSHRACIKLLDAKKSKDALFVRTFCRDHESGITNRYKDKTEGERHTVVRNTAFHLILHAGHPHFLCQKISGYKDYQNTSKEQLGGPGFPYEATIVVPIHHLAAYDESADPPTSPQHIALGFLAVDCTVPDVYLERCDVVLASIVADALFSVLYRWQAVERLMGGAKGRDTGRYPALSSQRL